jgi:hypothetical protein
MRPAICRHQWRTIKATSNAWTAALAAAGVIGFVSTGRAEEQPNAVLTALSSTMISGYVNASAWWVPGTGNANLPTFSYSGEDKADGFNLDSVKLTIERPLDEYPFSAGYRLDTMFGPDANTLGTASTDFTFSDLTIRQAYVILRTPLGNGLDVRLGVWDTIIGYETSDVPENPNYTRSYGYTIEPTTHTGLLITHQLTDAVSLAFGVANTFGPVINQKAHPPAGAKAESYKTYMGSIAFTATESMGYLRGSTLYAGVVNGFNSGTGVDQTSYYVGGTMTTPLPALKVGAAFDYVDVHRQELTGDQNLFAGAYALYLSFQAMEKLSFHLRGEYANNDVPGILTPLDLDSAGTAFDITGSKVFAATATIQYDFWKNLLSRIEVRWDHAADGSKPFGGTAVADLSDPTSGGNKRNHFIVAANVAYTF